MHVKLADERLHRPAAGARQLPQHSVPALGLRDHGRRRRASGYGFLSENARFAEILEEHNITFIGPKSEHIRIMGDKIEAKATAKRLGIPCVPGSDGPVLSEKEALKVAQKIGFPVLVKAASGGGGRGMKVARDAHDLGVAMATARTEAKAAFGDDTVYIEKYLQKPRHIEIRCFGDGKGEAIHLGERDCSLAAPPPEGLRGKPVARPQRRSARRDRRDLRQGDARAAICRRRHGRVPLREWRVLLHRDEHAHPGRASRHGDDHRRRSRLRADPRRRGFAAVDEAGRHSVLRPRDRVPRERGASATFRPSPGRIAYYHPPGGVGVRVDSAVYQGYAIPPNYDSLIGKLIVHGRNRTEALMRLRRSLDEFIVDGIDTRCPCFARSCAIPTCRTASMTSTGSSTSSRPGASSRASEKPHSDLSAFKGGSKQFEPPLSFRV